MSRPPISGETVRKMRAMLDQGATANEISKALGIGDYTVRRYAASIGLRPQSRRHSPETIAKIAELLRAGMTQTDVADEAGVNRSVVQYHAERLGIRPAEETKPATDPVYVDEPYPNLDGRQPCAHGDPELFHPQSEKQLKKDRDLLKRLCGRCPFEEPCRKYAIAHDVKGWWGGMSERQRSRYRTQNGIKPRPLRASHAPEPASAQEAS